MLYFLGTILVTKVASPLRGNMNKYMDTLLKSSLFSGIIADDVDSILDCLGAIIKKYQKNECILMAGNTTEYIGLLLTGKAIVIQEDYWGGQSVMSAILPGHTFAESYACTPGSVLDVSVYAEAASDLAGKNLRLGEKSKHMSQKTTRDKLLSYLSSEMHRHGSNEFDIPFSRQQLADFLSVDRSGLSTELGRMKTDGLIDFHKSHFVLKSPAQGWTDV